MLARQPAASILSPGPSHLSLPPSLSLCLSPVHSSLYPDWPVQYVAAGWMSVEGWREIGRQSYCHTVIGTKTWLMRYLPHPPFLSSSVSEFLFLNITLLIFLFQSTALCFFFLPPVVSVFIPGCFFLFYFYICFFCVAVYMCAAVASTFSETIVKCDCNIIYLSATYLCSYCVKWGSWRIQMETTKRADLITLEKRRLRYTPHNNTNNISVTGDIIKI